MEYKWILIGEIVSTQGNKGEIRVVAHTEFPERFLTMDQLLLFQKSGSEPAYRIKIENCRFHKGFVIIKLAGVDTIEQASALKGLEIKVHRSDVVPLPSGRNYIFELIGLKVITTEGVELGTITDVLQTGANDVYVVKPKPGITKNQEILIPVIEDVVLEVSLDNQTVLVKLLNGLLE